MNTAVILIFVTVSIFLSVYILLIKAKYRLCFAGIVRDADDFSAGVMVFLFIFANHIVRLKW